MTAKEKTTFIICDNSGAIHTQSIDPLLVLTGFITEHNHGRELLIYKKDPDTQKAEQITLEALAKSLPSDDVQRLFQTMTPPPSSLN